MITLLEVLTHFILALFNDNHVFAFFFPNHIVSLGKKFKPSLILRLGKLVHVFGICTTHTYWDN
jgi:hypothetical protein